MPTKRQVERCAGKYSKELKNQNEDFKINFETQVILPLYAIIG